MTWWKPGSLEEAAARAAFELVVELRTLSPTPGRQSDATGLREDLDRLARAAREVAPWITDQWPNLTEEINRTIELIREDPDAPQPWLALTTLADELEDHIGTGLRWPPRSDLPNN